MTSRLHVSVFLAISVGLWVLILLLRGTPITLEHLWPFGVVVTLLVGIVTWFDRWGWSWSVFHEWFVKRPNLRGTWKVTLESDWRNPATGDPIEPITCYILIEQTLSTLSMRLMTPESISWLIAYKIFKSNEGVFQVAGVYTNRPEIHLRGIRSEIHYGSILLDILGDPPLSLEGHYWTDRNTRGTMKLVNRNTKKYTSYESAQKYFRE